MRKRLLAWLVAAFMVFGAGAALAEPGAETGEGTNGECPEATEPAPAPNDATACDENLVADAGAPVAVGGHQDEAEPGGGVYVAVGEEENGLGRASVSGTQSGGSANVYAEDYTPGDAIADGVENGHEGAGCPLPIGDGSCDTATDSADDAVLITAGP